MYRKLPCTMSVIFLELEALLFEDEKAVAMNNDSVYKVRGFS